jgi:hypothetical protein
MHLGVSLLIAISTVAMNLAMIETNIIITSLVNFMFGFMVSFFVDQSTATLGLVVTVILAGFVYKEIKPR